MGDVGSSRSVAGGLVVASAPSANPAEGATSIVQIVTVGDIADNGGQQMRTAAMAQSFTPDRVLALGDNAYDSGTIGEFRTRWAPSWGRFDAIAWTVPGNHEYLTPNAAGYRDIFGIAGDTWWACLWRRVACDRSRQRGGVQLAPAHVPPQHARREQRRPDRRRLAPPA